MAWNDSMLRSSRTYACASRTPEMLSWNSALTVEIVSRACAYACAERRPNHTVAIRSGGTSTSTPSVSGQLNRLSTTSTPTKLRMLTTAVMRPVCSSCANASTSVVMRVMIRPDISRS